ncbi:hypothetical protein Patl1_31574 [Pistacia atlantica]|uniref:Uncharacterized protein n=1 Tax=Pistacia atlantica TaxID=434234 RepID=A0ACC1ARS9_9ROSI|nr:hypothetical protein Patl1_31574 [Pistacia atlantica]
MIEIGKKEIFVVCVD